MEAKHIPRTVIGTVFFFCMFITNTAGQASGSTTTNNEATPPHSALPKKDTLEETVFAEMLRIVDEKFDSLSARMSVLERSVNSLNFYSIRQFREITESIEESTAATEGVRDQMVKMDGDNRALKLAVSQIGRDVNTIKTENSRMFDDIANSIVYFNQNVEERTSELKLAMETTTKTAVATAAEVAAANADSGEDTAILIKYLEDMPRNVSCSVNFRPLEERIDLRFAEMKRQTHNNFVDLINADRSSSEEDPDEDEFGAVEGEDGDIPRGRPRFGPKRQEEVEEERRREGEMVMRLLANMTQNVMEATAYFRHTGSMIERLLARTESISEEQTRLRFDVLEASGLLTPGEGGEELFEELVNNMPGVASSEEEDTADDSYSQDVTSEMDSATAAPDTSTVSGANAGSSGAPANLARPQPPQRSSSLSAAFSAGALKSRVLASKSAAAASSGTGKGLAHDSIMILAELAKNGTQLLDVLTDLAQLSSTSLTSAVGSLHEEVVRLEDLRTRINAGLTGKTGGGILSQAGGGGLELGAGGGSQELRNLQNTTKTIFTIVEAIASNTGWIPYIFHNMQNVERLANRTLELAKKSLQQPQWSRPLGNEIPGVPEAQERRPGVEDEGQPAAMTQAEALDVIYETNMRLKRIMPALTRLLAEPEPLIALVEGKQPSEGRVEVFFKGHWRSVCQGSMGHSEASLICRHLSHNGGISAGSGHFGHGSAQQWALNVTCLSSGRCPAVWMPESSVTCTNGDFAVICDHMLRMVSIPEVNDMNTGRIEMHHQGLWLPVCAYGWSGYEARVACKQLGYRDGREFEYPRATEDPHLNSTAWVTGVGCSGEEQRLDACKVQSYAATECSESGKPAAVRCQ